MVNRRLAKKGVAFIIVTTLFFIKNGLAISDFIYEKQDNQQQIIHIVQINPAQYHIGLVKANEIPTGRETLPVLAKETSANIAINAGFFEINGMPSGTLVIQGQVYKVKNSDSSLLMINDNVLSILRVNPIHYLASSHSIVSGIPLLIQDGEINPELAKKTSGFYLNNHARTAIGIKANGTIVLVVAEHHTQRNSEGIDHGIQGLSILALAQLMKELGCQDALNLDGGGSSTLWLNGRVVNQPVGDVDEAEGQKTLRAISDAIIFKKK